MIHSRRKPIRKHVGARRFRGEVSKTHPYNMRMQSGIRRGGWRL